MMELPRHITGQRLGRFAFFYAVALLWGGFAAFGADFVVRPDQPNTVSFKPQKARFVRFSVVAADGGAQPCIDELEVYEAKGKKGNLAVRPGAKASASSLLEGYPAHKIGHLNDGQYGNGQSWIAAGTANEWAQIELSAPAEVGKVVFSRDRQGQFRDRTPIQFEVLLSMDGKNWTTARSVSGRAAGAPRGAAIPGPPAQPAFYPPADHDALLRFAVLGEEHAWLKTFGRADLNPALVPYNGRVKEYPRHAGDDRLPLPTLDAAPRLDADLSDPSWRGASRGVSRVAWPYDFDSGPLVTHAVTTARFGDDLYFMVEADRLLCGHVAALSCAGSGETALVLRTESGLVFNTYPPGGEAERRPLDGYVNPGGTRFTFRIPLTWLPDCAADGIRVGLGIGGKHTAKLGRPVEFFPAPLGVAEVPGGVGDAFLVRLVAGPEGAVVTGNAPELATGLKLAPGEVRELALAPEAGPIGPEFNLEINNPNGDPWKLHLFQYRPLDRVLSQTRGLLNRLSAKGLDMSAEGTAVDLIPRGDTSREAFLRARLAQRALFLRDPDLASLTDILLAKRHPFKPSHNYSVILDAPWNPGGGIYTLHIPWTQKGLDPRGAATTRLFDAGTGIARTPMADFGLKRVYFSHRPAEDGYYSIHSMAPDGSDLRRLTDGPFHDYWPCPLPDGGLAFISTRCRARFLCWRPQAAVMFRMNADGGDIRPLSYANLTEWAPSVMRDGRIIWTRSEYLDKGADFGHTLWAIHPDGTQPELVFGNTIIQPNGYANGREVPGTNEVCCTLISHFGDLNGPVALVNIDQGRFNPEAITSLTPEVPRPGMWPDEECFRDPVPVARDLFLVSHAPRDRFCVYVLDRFGNREILYADPYISCMTPTLFRKQETPPVIASSLPEDAPPFGEFVLTDVGRGLEPAVPAGRVKWLAVSQEVPSELEQLPDGSYRKDHEPFMNWYASPVDLVNGPYGWPTYVAKASLGIVPVSEDGSVRFKAPAGKVLYFHVLDENFNELQRMRSVVQLQPGETRSCVGCHESRHSTPVRQDRPLARAALDLEVAPWAGEPFSYERVVQPVLDAKCVLCHDQYHEKGLDFRGVLDRDRVPASYRTLITKGLVSYCDFGWNSGGCEKIEPLSVGTLKSRLWEVLDGGHHDVRLTTDQMRRIKTWIDLNCPLWPDYMDRRERPARPVGGQTE